MTKGGPPGLQPGDAITRTSDEPTDVVEDLIGILRRHVLGAAVTITIVRDGSEQELQVELGER